MQKLDVIILLMLGALVAAVGAWTLTGWLTDRLLDVVHELESLKWNVFCYTSGMRIGSCSGLLGL
jgi:hypothetical protein